MREGGRAAGSELQRGGERGRQRRTAPDEADGDGGCEVRGRLDIITDTRAHLT